MYQVAGRLSPDSYLALARAVYAEMALAGVTCVGEFHYLHHGPGGSPYPDPNEMGRALIQAAAEAGLRITLLDTCYLTGGLAPDGTPTPLSPVQQRFSDGDAARWADRLAALGPGRARDARAARPGRGGHPLGARGAARPDAPGRRLVPSPGGPAARAPVRAAGGERGLPGRLRRHPGAGARRRRGAGAAQHDGARHPPHPPRHRAARRQPELRLPVPDHGSLPGRRHRPGGRAGRGGQPALRWAATATR